MKSKLHSQLPFVLFARLAFSKVNQQKSPRVLLNLALTSRDDSAPLCQGPGRAKHLQSVEVDRRPVARGRGQLAPGRVRSHGKKFGGKADTAAPHLLQRAAGDSAFQREMRDKLQALLRGQTDGRRLGAFFDRVAHAEGRLQNEGTQSECKDGQWMPFESEDPANLDTRCISLWMTPIAEHMEQQGGARQRRRTAMRTF